MGRVLVVNSGSSSLKYQLIDTPGVDPATPGDTISADARSATRLARGLVERIGRGGAATTHGYLDDRGGWQESRLSTVVPDHDAALRSVVDALGKVGLDTGIVAVGHRVVHGGDRFVAPTVIDDDVLDQMRALVPLAPLHNPANITGIEVAQRLWPDVPQVAVFDTAFHATLPPEAYRYAVPETWYAEHGVRRYGFHGTSHAFVSREAARLLGGRPEDLRLVTLHLGNGASVTAVRDGRSVETSMGLTPLEGLVMGTRSGDIDPAIIFHLTRAAGLAPDEIDHALNHSSGLLALCGENDMRAVEARVAAGDAAARLALDVFCHRIRKYVGAYAAVLGGVDALVFTAGIGENSPAVRARVCDGLGFLGLALDPQANADGRTAIHAEDSAVAVLVVPTDEELEIAVQTLAAIR